MVRIALAHGSLTEGAETVLVNASNTNVALGTGVSGAIRQACGAGYQDHIARAMKDRFGGPMEPGDVLVTDAGNHPTAKWVVHIAVMDYREGFTGRSFPTLELISKACTKLWPAIEEIGSPVTVAMVALGAGTGQLGVRDPTRIACETLSRHLAATPASRIEGVTFYGYILYEQRAIADVVKGIFPDAV
jgi:O-acetyl-ADP-ribose deacetylase (regulator of RNase III)